MKLSSCCYLAILAPSIFLAACTTSATMPLSLQVGDITGTWTFAENNCADTYKFRPDGTFSSTSGEEALEGKYVSERVSSADPTRLKVVRTVIKDNLGKDCVGSTKDNSGKSDIRYVKFDSTGNELMVCSTPAVNRCFGPLLRAGN